MMFSGAKKLIYPPKRYSNNLFVFKFQIDNNILKFDYLWKGGGRLASMEFKLLPIVYNHKEVVFIQTNLNKKNM